MRGRRRERAVTAASRRRLRRGRIRVLNTAVLG
jgi:hypothetical protein